jgi:hypothetical protein
MARQFGRTRTSGIDKGNRPGYAGNVGTLVGRKTGIANNTATSIIRVTVPSGNQNAAIEVTLAAWLGTGTDQSESTRIGKGLIAIARQTGSVDTVAAAATIALTGIATVSGGGTLTLAYSVSSMSGANTGTQTFDIQVTLVVTGTITDHACMFEARLLNGQDNGVTMAAV